MRYERTLSTTVVFDLFQKTSRILSVKRGTILVNQNADGTFDSRWENNTILHECVHWMLHRYAYYLHKVSNPQMTAIACRRTSAKNRNREWTSFDRMEWQANALAPRILMPAWSTHFLADNYLRRMAKLPARLGIQRTAENLSTHFQASKSLTRIRLAELGYKDAEQLYPAPTQFDVELPDAMHEYRRNEQFRSALQAGVFAYVDNRFCIRNSRYIARDDAGELRLTPYARSHPSECCLSFAHMQYRNTAFDGGMYRTNRIETKYVESVSSDNTARNLTEMRKHITQIAAIQRKLPSSFEDTLYAHMERLNLSVEELSERSGVSERTIKRCRSNCEHAPSKQTVVALCIGLRLPSVLSRDLLSKSGICFRNGEEDIAYQMIIDSMTVYDIYQCNETLQSLGVRTLSKQE